MSKSKYSILIICEGRNTEPHFFNSIRDEIINKKYDIGNCSIRIRPEPSIEEEEEIKASPNKPNFKSRTTKKAINGEEPEDIKGIPPLKWVEAGKEELKNGTFDEVWAVFDHDNHPAREAAFNAAEEQINGSNVKIAFSSRSFEYYILLHFEKIYYTFTETECNTGGKNPKSLVCSTGVHSDDCYGKTCINGYARLKGYWDNSKKSQSIFPLIKDKLELGFINSEWLRLESDKNEGGVKKHDRNPYITTDSLVKRLTGDNFEWKWLFINNSININGLTINLLNNSELHLTNTSNQIIIIPENSFIKFKNNNEKELFGNKIILQPAGSESSTNNSVIKLDKNAGNSILFFVFTFKNNKIIFS